MKKCSCNEHVKILLQASQIKKEEDKQIFEKLHRQLETNNTDGAKILIQHCLEKMKELEFICAAK